MMSTATLSRTRLVCGANVHEAEGLVGQTVGSARGTYTDVLNIPPEAQARVGGQPVGNDHVIAENETFEFVKPAGTKG